MPVYNKIRSYLSHKNQGRLSRYLVYTDFKPTVNRKVRSPYKKGTLVFSADFEMGWAFRFSKAIKDKAVQKGLLERKNMSELLSLFNKNKIVVTWATVGHLFLDKCTRGKNGFPHPEMFRPLYFENRNWSFQSGDWYQHDPCSGYLKDPAWYAPDLIDMILSSDVEHEIGCHSFSHIDFTYGNCPSELAEAELDACIKAASEKNVELRSMVFPGGTFGNYESLTKKGIICYRKPMEHHIDLPYLDKYGLIAIPSSLGLDKDPYGWTREFHLKMTRKYIDKAARHRLVCHFWFHPSMNKWYLENVMPGIIETVKEYRDSGQIDVKTMTGLAIDYKKILNIST